MMPVDPFVTLCARQVEAVIVHGHMLREAALERRRQLNPVCKSEPGTAYPAFDPQAMAFAAPLKVEEVLIAQLHHRARLLDAHFQEEVLAVIKKHAVPEACLQEATLWAGNSDNAGGPHGQVLSQASSEGQRGSHKENPLVHFETSEAMAEDLPSWGRRIKRIRRSMRSGQELQRGMLVQLGWSLQPRRTDLDLSTVEVPRAAPTGTDTSTGSNATEMQCAFGGGSTGLVEVHPAPVKTVERAREKLGEYAAEGAAWPLVACILDPVRAAVVCEGPAHMVEVANWFLDGGIREGGCGDGCEEAECSSENGAGRRLRPCRIKNKFVLEQELLVTAHLRTGFAIWFKCVYLLLAQVVT
jgi:hypothetical protein